MVSEFLVGDWLAVIASLDGLAAAVADAKFSNILELRAEFVAVCSHWSLPVFCDTAVRGPITIIRLSPEYRHTRDFGPDGVRRKLGQIRYQDTADGLR